MPYLLFRAGELLPVQNLLENMIWSLLHPENNRRRITQTTMGLLFLELLSHMETGELPKQEENRCVLEALREVEENYAQADLTRVAQSQGVSLSYVSAQVHRPQAVRLKNYCGKNAWIKLLSCCVLPP